MYYILLALVTLLIPPPYSGPAQAAKDTSEWSFPQVSDDMITFQKQVFKKTQMIDSNFSPDAIYIPPNFALVKDIQPVHKALYGSAEEREVPVNSAYRAPVQPKISPFRQAQTSIHSIKLASTKMSVPQPLVPTILARIATCESGNRQYDESGDVVHGKIHYSDTGKYQINADVWGITAKKLGHDLSTELGNEAMALFIYNQLGVSPWDSSRPCWGKYL